MGFVRQWLGRVGWLDSVLGWLERFWSWLPDAAKGVIVLTALGWLAALWGVTLAALLWFGDFVTDYWTLGLIAILAGAGGGTQIRGAAEWVASSLDGWVAERRESRGGIRVENEEFIPPVEVEFRRKVGTLLPHLDPGSHKVLWKLLDAPMRLYEGPAGIGYQYSPAVRVLIDHRIIRVVGTVDSRSAVWEINPGIESTVEEYFEGVGYEG